MSLRNVIAAALASLALADATAQWTNPNPTGAVSVAVMVGTNGAAHTPKTLSGFVQIGADRFVAVEIQLGGELIDNWDDLAGASFLNLGQYVTGASGVTAPSAPYANILQSGSAPSFTLARAKGVNGVLVTNDANGNVIVDGGNPTGTVDALFPPQTSAVVRFYYRPPSAPYNMTPVDSPVSTNGYLYSDGTNLYFLTTVSGTASNAVLFNSQGPDYYRNFANLTNFWLYDDGQLDATDLAGIEAGVNADWEFVYRTNNSGSQLVARLNLAGGSNDLGRLNSSNRWTEFNQFEDDAHFEGRLIRSGQGVTLADGATVSGTASNMTASGQQSTAAGGFGNVASGTKATVSGGSGNTASGTGSTIGGGINHTAGDYSAVGGGDDIDVTGQWSAGPGGLDYEIGANYVFGFGRYFAATNADSAYFLWGDTQTNKMRSRKARSFLVAWDGTNTGTVGINTVTPTNALEVVGQVKATSFEGDGSALTGVPAGSNAVIVVLGASTSAANISVVSFPGACSTCVVYKANTAEVYGIGGGGSGSGTVNFTNDWASIYSGTTNETAYLEFGASGTVYASTGPTGAPQFRTLASLGAATGMPLYGFTESDPIWAAVSNAIKTDIDLHVELSGETSAVNLTNAASVKVPTPSAAQDAATKGYVDSAASASVTNAIDKGLANGGNLLTGLNTLDIVGQGQATVSNQASGPTGRWYITASGPYTESATGNIAPTSGTHTVGGVFASVGGGGTNVASGNFSRIGGGSHNSATGVYATVSGGNGNQAAGWYSSVGGGETNVAGNAHSSVVGGQNVQVYSPHSIAFGQDIFISGDGDAGRWSVAFGGRNRLVSSQGSFVSGFENAITNAQQSSLSGGYRCWIEGANSYRSAIAGGNECHISGASSIGGFIGAGWQSAITNSDLAGIIGGYGNVIVDNGDYGFIGGGISNRVTGVASVALGAQAEALHSGSFVWSDWFQGYTGTAFKSSSSNQFLIQASGGVGINTNAPVQGGLTVGGPIYSTLDVGQLYMQAVTNTSDTSYTTMSNWTAKVLPGVMTGNTTNGTLTIPRDGTYLMQFSVSYSQSSASSREWAFAIHVNGSEQVNVASYRTVSANGTIGSLSGSGYVTTTNGAIVTLGVSSSVAETPVYRAAQLVVERRN